MPTAQKTVQAGPSTKLLDGLRKTIAGQPLRQTRAMLVMPLSAVAKLIGESIQKFSRENPTDPGRVEHIDRAAADGLKKSGLSPTKKGFTLK